MAKKDEARMTFTEHLGELRLRIIHAMLALLVGFIVCYASSKWIFAVVSRPLAPLKEAGIITDAPPSTAPQPGEAPPPSETTPVVRTRWYAGNPLEPFLVRLKLAAYAGLVLAMPVVLYQLCAFVFPGLKAREKRAVRFLLFGCTLFAVFGVVVAYLGVFPLVLPYLSRFLPDGVEQQFRMGETVSLIIKGLAGFAIAFQFPMVVLVLVYLDLLSPATLKQYRRVAIILMAVGAAVLTPPDPISMMIMLLPLALLYEMSIWMSYLVVRRRRKERPDTGAAGGG